MNIWDILGISETVNVRDIKKAYASKAKIIHPEEEPQQFQRLHDAYQAALSYAKMLGSIKDETVVTLDDKINEQGSGSFDELHLFTHFDGNALLAQRRAAIEYLKEIFDSTQWNSSQVWKNYVLSDIFQSVKKDNDFLGYLYHVLQVMQIRKSYVDVLYDGLEFNPSYSMLENEEKLYKLLKPYCSVLLYNAQLSRVISMLCFIVTIFIPLVSPLFIPFILILHVLAYWRLVWYPKKHYEDYDIEDIEEFNKYISNTGPFFWTSLLLQFFILVICIGNYYILAIVFLIIFISILLYVLIAAIKALKSK